MKWDSIRLGEVMDVKHGYAFTGQGFADSGDLVLLTPGNCHESGGLRLKGEREKYYAGDFPSEFLLKEGDMLVVMTDLINTAPILGGCFVIPENNRFLHNQRLGLVQITDATRIDKTFLYYLLNTPNYRAQVRGSASGATVRHTSPSRIRDCKVRVPREVAHQHQIGATLSAYDDLIENNRQRMALLEDAARQLYREWFVRLRFPGHEHTRVTDGVPAGWKRVPTPEAIEINPPTRLSAEAEHWSVEMADLTTDSMVVQRATKREGRSGSKFRNGDTLFARITPCLENGKTAFVDFLDNGETARGSTEFIVLRGKRVTPEYVYCLARSHDFRGNAIKSMVGSSGRQRVQESCFEKFFVLIPSSTLLDLFTEYVRPQFRQIKTLHAQNLRLRTARDLLLPRLMSGELAV